ncbi:MAG: MATE family efflux transporter [Ruminococcus sp.]
MQQATVQMGKIAIQALVNTMGVSVAAAFAVVNRIDDFAITPEQNIAHAMTALMAQNKGAGKNDRMREGFRCGMILELVYGAAVMLICLGFARPLMSLFVKDEEVIGHGVVYLHLIAVMYILPAVTNALRGFFRGIGDLKVTLMSSFTNMTVRVIAAAPMVLLWNFGIEALPYSYLAGWIAMLLVETPLMLRIYRKSKSKRKDILKTGCPFYEKKCILFAKETFDKSQKIKMPSLRIVIYKIVTIHITFCYDPFWNGKCIQGTCIFCEFHIHASFNLFFKLLIF